MDLDFPAKWEVALTETEKALGSVATQLMSGEEVILGDQKSYVKRVVAAG
jgi:hypothetical protein